MSSRIPQNFIDELIGRIDIIELIDGYVPLRKKGSSYQACCPFHSEKTPSFNVSSTKQLYHCFGCGVGGNAIHFLMAHEKIDFIDALQRLAERAGLTLPKTTSYEEKTVSKSLYPLLEEAAVYFQNTLKNSSEAIHYLKNRGISGQTAKTFRIGYVPDEWDSLCKQFLHRYQAEDLLDTGLFVKKEKGGLYDRFRDRIMFPICDTQGRVIAFGGRSVHQGEPKYLNSPETPLFHKGKELYGLYEARQAQSDLESIWVVEGYMDVISLSQAGIKNVVATLGTAITSQHLKRLLRFTSELVFCLDGDKAGQQAAKRALEALLPLMQDDHRARFIILPEGEDPDSAIKQGSKSFLSIPSLSMPEFFFSTLLKEIDMSVPEGRAKLAKNAMDHIQKIPGKFLQQIMLDRLSSLTRINASRLEVLGEIKPSKTNNISYQKSKKQTSTRISPMRLAIILLLQYPHLLEKIEWPSILNSLKLPGLSLLKEIYELLKENSHLTTAMLIEHWRDKAEESTIQKLALQAHWVPEKGVLQELQGAFAQLAAKGSEHQVEGLLQEAQMRDLTSEEKFLLQQLIKERAK